VAASIDVSALREALAGAATPSLIDVRRAPVFALADALLAGAVWRDPAGVDDWARRLDGARAVVVYCVHGHQVSQECADRLLALGFNARYLDGGYEAWTAAGLPLAVR
jgi:rhodanese-related sulfurtransferase